MFYRMDASYPGTNALRGTQLELQQLGFDMLTTLTRPNLIQNQPQLFNQLLKLLKMVEAQWGEVALWHPKNHEFYNVLSYGAAIWPDSAEQALDLDLLPQIAQVVDGQRPFAGEPVDDLRDLLDTVQGKSVLVLPLLMKLSS